MVVIGKDQIFDVTDLHHLAVVECDRGDAGAIGVDTLPVSTRIH